MQGPLKLQPLLLLYHVPLLSVNNPTNPTVPPPPPLSAPPPLTATHGLLAKVVAVLTWYGFPASSEVPAWIKSLLVSLPEDALRRFLIFVCGTPSLPAPSAGKVRNEQDGGGGGRGVLMFFMP